MNIPFHLTLALTDGAESLAPLPTQGMTVVVVCHNYGRFLAQALASVFAQTEPPARVIVVDDSSTDDTAAVAALFPLAEYRSVSFGDCAASRNSVLPSVTTPWILHLDADNWLATDALARASAVARLAPPNVAGVYFTRSVFGNQSSFLPAIPYDPKRLEYENYVDAGMLLRTDALRGAGGWPGPRGKTGYLRPMHEDWGLVLRLLQTGWDFAPCAEAVLHYRVHSLNQSNLGGEPLLSQNTLIRNARVTLLTLFCGRTWALPRYFDWLDRCDLNPALTSLLFVDNSGDASFGRFLRARAAAESRFLDCRVIQESATCDPDGALGNGAFAEGDAGVRLVRDAALHRHVAGLYGDAFARADGQFVLCVEDDVVPPADVLSRLMPLMAYPGDVGAAAARVMSRLHPGQVIAGAITHDGRGSSTLNPLGDVGFSSAGCTLYRTRALRDCRPRYEDEGPLFWDVSLGIDMAKASWRTVLTDCPTQHYEPDGSWV